MVNLRDLSLLENTFGQAHFDHPINVSEGILSTCRIFKFDCFQTWMVGDSINGSGTWKFKLHGASHWRFWFGQDVCLTNAWFSVVYLGWLVTSGTWRSHINVVFPIDLLGFKINDLMYLWKRIWSNFDSFRFDIRQLLDKGASSFILLLWHWKYTDPFFLFHRRKMKSGRSWGSFQLVSVWRPRSVLQ